MTEYMIPAEPDGPVWGQNGTKWGKRGGQFWNSDGSTLVPWTWDELLQYHGPLRDYPPESDPWEAVKPGRLYWVTGRDNYRERRISSIAFGATINGESVDYLSGDGWALWRAEQHTNRLQSAVELTAIPTHLLDALIETAVDYDDPEDGTSVSREALHDLTDWLADHPQNTGDSHA